MWGTEQGWGPQGSEPHPHGGLLASGGATTPRLPKPSAESLPTRGHTDRADADVLGEEVVRQDVLVQLLCGPLPQAGTVMALVQVEDGYRGEYWHRLTQRSQPIHVGSGGEHSGREN